MQKKKCNYSILQNGESISRGVMRVLHVFTSCFLLLGGKKKRFLLSRASFSISASLPRKSHKTAKMNNFFVSSHLLSLLVIWECKLCICPVKYFWHVRRVGGYCRCRNNDNLIVWFSVCPARIQRSQVFTPTGISLFQFEMWRISTVKFQASTIPYFSTNKLSPFRTRVLRCHCQAIVLRYFREPQHNTLPAIYCSLITW